jgi:hypothetical protein
LGLRFTVTARLLVTLAGLAAFTSALVVGVQERTLSRDLENAAARRLDRAAHASDQLVHGHLAALDERYRAISGTPQFRANLEVEIRRRWRSTPSSSARSRVRRRSRSSIARAR